MGIPIVVKGNKHICPMVEGLKPHVGGPVSETSINGVTINGQPIAVEGDKCICTGGSAPDEIVQGCQGVLIDGKPVAILGSMTLHGGILIEGVPGVTISGPLVPMAGDPKTLDPKIFNLQWKNDKGITRVGEFNKKNILSADTVGYEDGEEVMISIYNPSTDEFVGDVTGVVENNRIEIEWLNEDKEGEDGAQ